MTIGLVNPLPTALRHYERALVEVLRAAGLDPTTLPAPGIERDATGSIPIRALRSLRWRRSLRNESADVVVLWPAFGLLDPLTFGRRAGRTWVVVHDPVPLRRQLGMSGLAARLGRRGLSSGRRVLVHSTPAREALDRQHWPSALVPHPILPPTDPPPARGEELSVLGQWKPARSLAALEVLGRESEWAGKRRIHGRAWPPVAGWDVDSRFLDERELDEQISAAAAVVLPYDRYFQSGIAVRCLERGVPVVGRSHPFLTELFGEQWPGVVVGEDWPAAVRRAAAVAPADLARLQQQQWDRCLAGWRGVLARVGGAEGTPGA